MALSKRATGVVIFLVLGVMVIVGLAIWLPRHKAARQKDTSDARDIKAKITLGLDNWIGYFPIQGKEMKKRMREAGYMLQIDDDGDNVNYDARMKKLREGKLDLAVATVDSYILNAANYDYPALIVMVIDESKGGDAIIARKDIIASLDDLKKKNFKFAFTPSSPSEHLMKSIGAHFDIPKFQDKKCDCRVETNGSIEAKKKLLAGQVEVAILWQPDVAQALAADDRLAVLIDTKNTSKLIVDILLANRDYVEKNPEAVEILIGNYFRVLKYYRDNQALWEKEIANTRKIPLEQVETMLAGVAFVNLQDNAQEWFSRTQQGLVDSIEGAVSILIDSKDFKSNPLPESDASRIIQSKFIENLSKRGIAGQFNAASGTGTSAQPVINSLERKFEPLDDKGWESLKSVGTMRVRNITFQSGTADLNLNGQEEVDRIADSLKHYPNFRIVVKGHTGLSGDKEANLTLSQDRAEAVSRYFQITYNIDPNRQRVIGCGSASPLPREPGESDRSFNYRLMRVEVSLVTEVY